ncbi:hypothetical protein HN011_002929 [Eciton burchellii]|nr:hypothetical protein HN011_002929 [Eciton burchellii]
MIGLRRRSGKELARYPVELLARLQSPRSTYRQICMLLREDGKMEIPCSFHAWNSGIGITSAADSCPQLYPEYAKTVSKSWIRGFVRQISNHHCPTFRTARLSRLQFICRERHEITSGSNSVRNQTPKPNFRRRVFRAFDQIYLRSAEIEIDAIDRYRAFRKGHVRRSARDRSSLRNRERHREIREYSTRFPRLSWTVGTRWSRNAGVLAGFSGDAAAAPRRSMHPRLATTRM